MICRVRGIFAWRFVVYQALLRAGTFSSLVLSHGEAPAKPLAGKGEGATAVKGMKGSALVARGGRTLVPPYFKLSKTSRVEGGRDGSRRHMLVIRGVGYEFTGDAGFVEIRMDVKSTAIAAGPAYSALSGTGREGSEAFRRGLVAVLGKGMRRGKRPWKRD